MCPHDRAGRYEVMGEKVCAGAKDVLGYVPVHQVEFGLNFPNSGELGPFGRDRTAGENFIVLFETFHIFILCLLASLLVRAKISSANR